MDFITHNMSHGRVQQRSDDTTNTNSPEYDKEIERVWEGKRSTLEAWFNSTGMH